MKTIGLIGGMSWESTATYYKVINETVKKTLGGLHSAKCFLYSVDFAEIEKCQSLGLWDQSADILIDAARRLELAGAEFILICTNTMHKVACQIQSNIQIPLLHIADATADVLIQSGIDKTALLGTKYTMTEDFYKSRLLSRGIEVLVPDQTDIDYVNSVIYNELCLGIISDKSKEKYLHILDLLAERGAKGAVLGCTEIGLLIGQADSNLPLFDTTIIHAEKAARISMGIDSII